MMVEETRSAQRRFLALGLGVISLLYLVVFVLPMLYMVAVSFGETRLATDQLGHHGALAAYTRFWQSSYYRRIMFYSLRLAGTCIVVTLIAVINPLFVSTIVRAFGLNMFLRWIHLDRTFTAVVIGSVQILLPFMVIPLMSGFRNLDPLTIHSARTLGSGRLRIAFRVVLPVITPALLAGSVLVFILSMNIFSIPLILGEPSHPTLALVVYQSAFTHANFTFAAAVALVLLAATLVVIALQGRVLRAASSREVVL
jgi:ABC-type spermidine/putrescine transport system permease subunit I